ncbi:MAG: rhodanese-like domain-containing protein [Flavobacteriales bacterium]|nr:rhodanese-like domain-containing protein [Flavobacteriales bacterium]
MSDLSDLHHMRSTVLIMTLMFTAGTCLAQAEVNEVLTVGKAGDPVQDLTPAQVQELIGKPDVVVYDCNEDYMHDEAHVPGAILIAYDEVSAEKLPTDPSTTLVFYCYSPECPASLMAAKSAVALGFTKVYYMLAGIVGWQEAGLRTEP